MKDCKTRQKYVSKWLRMEFFPNGDYGIHFLLGFMYFEFTKDNQLKYSIESKQFRKGRVVHDPDINWRRFKDNVKRHEPYEKVPALIKRLAVWRFSNPPQYRMVEQQIGCVTFFKREEDK